MNYDSYSKLASLSEVGPFISLIAFFCAPNRPVEVVRYLGMVCAIAPVGQFYVLAEYVSFQAVCGWNSRFVIQSLTNLETMHGTVLCSQK